MSNKRYLQRLGQSWYIRIKVPAGLQDKVGNTHIRRALHTRDLDVANRLKWSAILQVHKHFERLTTGASSELTLSKPEAVLPASASAPDGNLAASLSGLRPTSGLDALAEEWAATSALKTVQFQRQQAYKELRSFLGGDRPPPAVTGATAAAYVDGPMLSSADSPSTRRRKLSALAAFWEWMATRRYIPRATNPWRGFRVSTKERDATRPKKRAYTMPELVKLFSGHPTYPALREVMVLGLYTGARIDELCSLARGDARISGPYVYLSIRRSKTDAGTRTLAVWHRIPKEILRKRLRGKGSQTAQLFPELKGGGYDQKLSWHVGQAFRYHRNGRGLTGETDFHSLRRTFITRLENLGVDQVRIARYVGHSLPTLAFQLYSGGATEATQAATGRAINYPPDVEAAVTTFLHDT